MSVRVVIKCEMCPSDTLALNTENTTTGGKLRVRVGRGDETGRTVWLGRSSVRWLIPILQHYADTGEVKVPYEEVALNSYKAVVKPDGIEVSCEGYEDEVEERNKFSHEQVRELYEASRRALSQEKA